MNREPELEPEKIYATPLAPLSEAGVGSLPAVAPWLFAILMIPFGVSTGYVSVTLGSLLSKGGVSVDQFAELTALGTLPHTFKFFWSPVVDVTLSARIWYVLSTLLASVSIALLGAFPANETSLNGLGWFVFLGGLATTVTGMAADILMAHATPPDQRGRAGGWSQAGNVGGGAIGGGLGLLIATRVPYHWIASSTIGLLCALCCLALPAIPAARAEERSRTFLDLIWSTLKDGWNTARERRGLLALILCAVPLGIGASSALWSAMAPEWNTGDDTVAVVTGILGGVVSTAGCLAGGWCCDRWHRQKCYVAFGIAVSLCGVLMAYLPHTREMFVLTTLMISFCAGMSWAGYMAFVLDVIGTTGAATKFSAFASLANLPIYYMNYVNAWSRRRWNTDGMLYFEAAMGVAGAIVFVIAVALLLPRRRPGETPAAP